MPVSPSGCQLSGNNIRDLIVAELLNAYEVALSMRKGQVSEQEKQEVLASVFADFAKVGSKYDSLHIKS